ncbi:neuroligin-2-like [Eriocheir sinensis]|uniref:neuroligin-2-like n=1 Tax=Eriocheir sinensis TaxID=95602 RepID=UPI0021C6F28A|nr:neuroligin-2-like [Eriocheir sinensis]
MPLPTCLLWAASWRLWAVVVVGVGLASAGVGGFIRSSHVVNTETGRLRGILVNPNNRVLKPVALFLGVPYAAPPVGRLRFMPPQSALRWSGIRQAITLPPVCPQKPPDVTNKYEALKIMSEGRYNYLQRLLPMLSNQSEDCLYLNVYTPVRGESRGPEGGVGKGSSEIWKC